MSAHDVTGTVLNILCILFLIWLQLQYYEIGIMTSVLPMRNLKQLKVT